MIPYACPECRAPLPKSAAEMHCALCGADYPVVDGLRRLVRPSRRAEFESLEVAPFAAADHQAIDQRHVLQANLAYHAQHADAYEGDASTALVFSAEATARIRDVLARARSANGARAWLDVGCGTGHVLAIVAPEVEASLGLDLSPAMLARAMRRGLSVAQAEADRLPVADNSVDVLSAFALLHHLFDPAAFYAEAFRVLRPGGLLYTDSDPNVRPRRSNPLYRFARAGYYRLSRLGRSRIDDDQTANALAQVADYQMFNSRDFNGDTQVEALTRAGFAQVRVIYHFNTSSLDRPGEASLPTQVRGLLRTPLTHWFDLRYMADHFLLLAQKPTDAR